MRKKKALLSFSVAVVFSITCSVLAFANSFNGVVKDVSNNGAEAQISCRNVYVPNTSGACSSAWVMTNDKNNELNYAQVGWSKTYGQSGPVYFWEWGNGSTWDSRDIGVASIGTISDYKVGCDATTMYFILDNVTYHTTPLSSMPWSRNRVLFAGETNISTAQCPGTAATTILFYSTKYKNTSNVWGITTTTPYVVGSNMGHDYYPNDFDIWDTRY